MITKTKDRIVMEQFICLQTFEETNWKEGIGVDLHLTYLQKLFDIQPWSDPGVKEWLACIQWNSSNWISSLIFASGYDDVGNGVNEQTNKTILSCQLMWWWWQQPNNNED